MRVLGVLPRLMLVEGIEDFTDQVALSVFTQLLSDGYALKAPDVSYLIVRLPEEPAPEAIAAQVAAVQEAAEHAAPSEAVEFLRLGAEAAAQIDLDETATRERIDQQLRDRGWEANTKELRFSEGTRPAKGRNMAIAEWPTASGPADYALFVGMRLVGVVEAKRQRKNVSAAIDQGERYSATVRVPICRR